MIEDRDARNLGACRILIFAFAILYYAPRDVTQWAAVPGVFWNPMLLFRVLGLGVPSEGALLGLQWIWRASLVLSCAGWFTRISMIVAGICGAYLIALANNYGKVGRVDAAFAVALLLMALSRCGDAWSVDAKLRVAAPRVWRFEYQWPVAAIRMLLALSFFAAGFAKLRHRGLEWITTDSLSILLGEESRLEEPWFPSATLWLVAHPLLCSAIAGVTVAVETLYPLALISRKARLILVPSAVLLLEGIRALQGPAFHALAALQLFWVDWPSIVDWVRSRKGGKTIRAAAFRRPPLEQARGINTGQGGTA